MAAKKPDDAKLVRKSLMVDPAKLEQARKALGVATDAEALRLALDHVLSHFRGGHNSEEE